MTVSHEVFEDPNTRYLRLGELIDNGQYSVEVTPQPSQAQFGFILTRWRRDLLASLDPSEIGRQFARDERVYLLTSSDDGVVRVVPADDPLQALDVVVVRRMNLSVISQGGDGLVLEGMNDYRFVVSDVGSLVYQNFDNKRTVADAIRDTVTFIEATPDALEELTKVSRNAGKTLTAYVTDESLALINELQRSGSVTVEPHG